jgi:ABC-type uncharacterized transport system fused permease/ATPase subunit
MCVNTLQYIGAILSYLTLAIPIFAHLYDNLSPGDLNKFISNYSFKCNYLVYLFTRLYDLSNEISLIAGNSHRVGQLIECIQSNEIEHEQKKIVNLVNVNSGYQSAVVCDGGESSQDDDQVNTQRSFENSEVCFKTVNLSVMTPNRSRTLIKNLNFKFEINKNVLITGKYFYSIIESNLMKILNLF